MVLKDTIIKATRTRVTKMSIMWKNTTTIKSSMMIVITRSIIRNMMIMILIIKVIRVKILKEENIREDTMMTSTVTNLIILRENITMTRLARKVTMGKRVTMETTANMARKEDIRDMKITM